MTVLLKALNSSVKPIVTVVRGSCVGIAFTYQSLVDFCYCGPDALFSTPFMKSYQSPEGSSTLYFPQMLGPRLGYEALMLDKPINARKAVSVGFANEVIEELKDEPDWFDIKKVPAIGKLLDTDLFTLTNCKRLLNQAKPNIDELLQREGETLISKWMRPDFEENMANYIQSIFAEKEKKAKL
jgi:enoyl-CoA hydratase/carnithine racemase